VGVEPVEEHPRADEGRTHGNGDAEAAAEMAVMRIEHDPAGEAVVVAVSHEQARHVVFPAVGRLSPYNWVSRRALLEVVTPEGGRVRVVAAQDVSVRGLHPEVYVFRQLGHIVRGHEEADDAR
jgi:hypothetical protein